WPAKSVACLTTLVPKATFIEGQSLSHGKIFVACRLHANCGFLLHGDSHEKTFHLSDDVSVSRPVCLCPVVPVSGPSLVRRSEAIRQLLPTLARLQALQ